MNTILNLLKSDFFATNGFVLTNLVKAPESKEYAASRFKLNDKTIIYRESKITPKKVGQFVTCWKRNTEGVTTPFDETDLIDFYLIYALSENQSGLFVLPKTVLIQKGILSTILKDGKRGFRVYPSWDKPLSKQARKTQVWQAKYFVDLNETQAENMIKSILN